MVCVFSWYILPVRFIFGLEVYILVRYNIEFKDFLVDHRRNLGKNVKVVLQVSCALKSV